uniref:GDP-fucose protein O-fucosyltransferase 1 n=1 Tax=Phallusia mammillata TaxID=59560 RepID=A0A6F9DPT0_9ASCI|nr:GDP-fucose protein O-fucosyltransferase 1-like [Phallusia mammillata]
MTTSSIKKLLLTLTITLILLFSTIKADVKFDSNGYVMYCPCMGRFGNQFDHFLGSLSFAKKLNRTLVVPPFITHDYRTAKYGNDFVPYREWFDFETLKEYHRVIEMDVFMKDYAPTIWPTENRIVYCHPAAMERSNDKKTCPAKAGNPFGPFWNHFKIDFVQSEGYPTTMSYASAGYKWQEKYPPYKHLVIVFMGAPASYPIQETDRKLQTYVTWSKQVQEFADNFISKEVKRPFVGIHLRIGIDWKRACQHVGDSILYPFMSSPQCVGYSRSNAIPFTKEMCFPSSNTIKEQVLNSVKQINAKSLFIATDSDSMEKVFNQMFQEAGLNVQIVRVDHDSLVSDLSVLVEADDFIGSCASSVSAFVVRKRELLGRPNKFFGMAETSADHSEL